MVGWDQDHAVVAEKTLTFGRQFWVDLPPHGRVGFCKQKVFKLREDIRLWTGEDEAQELFRLRTGKIMDFHAAFDLVDASGQVLGHFRRRGWKSMFKPEWLLYDARGQQVGTFTVDSGWMVWARRNVPLGQLLFPTTYHLRLGDGKHGQEVARAVERRRLWGDTFDVHRQPGSDLDLRVAVGLTILSMIFSESDGA